MVTHTSTTRTYTTKTTTTTRKLCADGEGYALTREVYAVAQQRSDPSMYEDVSCIPDDEFSRYSGDVTLAGLKNLVRIGESAFSRFEGTLKINGSYPMLESIGEDAFLEAGTKESALDFSSTPSLDKGVFPPYNYKAVNNGFGGFTTGCNVNRHCRLIASLQSFRGTIRFLCPDGSGGLTHELYEAAMRAEDPTLFADVTCIPKFAFAGYSLREAIFLGGNLRKLTHIDDGAFLNYACKGRNSVTIGGKYPVLESIGYKAFDCYSFYDNSDIGRVSADLTGMQSLKVVKDYAFYYMKGNLKMAGEYPKLEMIGRFAFFNYLGYMNSDVKITGLPSLRFIGISAFSNVGGHMTFTGLYPQLKIIEGHVFYKYGGYSSSDCYNCKVELTGLPLLENIGDGVFQNWRGELKITGAYPMLNYIGRNAFDINTGTVKSDTCCGPLTLDFDCVGSKNDGVVSTCPECPDDDDVVDKSTAYNYYNDVSRWSSCSCSDSCAPCWLSTRPVDGQTCTTTTTTVTTTSATTTTTTNMFCNGRPDDFECKEFLAAQLGDCYEAYKPDHPTCSGYEGDGIEDLGSGMAFVNRGYYTCVGAFCAAMNPLRHSQIDAHCAVKAPAGFFVNPKTGKCERVTRAKEAGVSCKETMFRGFSVLERCPVMCNACIPTTVTTTTTVTTKITTTSTTTTTTATTTTGLCNGKGDSKLYCDGVDVRNCNKKYVNLDQVRDELLSDMCPSTCGKCTTSTTTTTTSVSTTTTTTITATVSTTTETVTSTSTTTVTTTTATSSTTTFVNVSAAFDGSTKGESSTVIVIVIFILLAIVGGFGSTYWKRQIAKKNAEAALTLALTTLNIPPDEYAEHQRLLTLKQQPSFKKKKPSLKSLALKASVTTSNPAFAGIVLDDLPASSSTTDDGAFGSTIAQLTSSAAASTGTSIGSDSTNSLPIEEEPWYHGDLSKDACEQMLKDSSSVPGTFLIRASASFFDAGVHKSAAAAAAAAVMSDQSYVLSYRPFNARRDGTAGSQTTMPAVVHCPVVRGAQSNTWGVEPTSVGGDHREQFATVAKLVEYYRSRCSLDYRKAKIVEHVTETETSETLRAPPSLADAIADAMISDRVLVAETSFTEAGSAVEEVVALEDSAATPEEGQAIGTRTNNAIAHIVLDIEGDSQMANETNEEGGINAHSPTPEEVQAIATSVNNFIARLERDIDGVSDLVLVTNEEDANKAGATVTSTNNFIARIELDIEGISEIVSETNEEDEKNADDPTPEEARAIATSVSSFIARLERDIDGVSDVVLATNEEDATAGRSFTTPPASRMAMQAGDRDFGDTRVNDYNVASAGAGANNRPLSSSTGAGTDVKGVNEEYLEVIGAAAAVAAAGATTSAAGVEATIPPSRQQQKPPTRTPSPKTVVPTVTTRTPKVSTTRLPSTRVSSALGLAPTSVENDYASTMPNVNGGNAYERAADNNDDVDGNGNDYANIDDNDYVSDQAAAAAGQPRREIVLRDYVPCLSVAANQASSKFVAPVMVLGKNTLSAHGLATIMGVDPKTYRDIRNKVKKIIDEFRKYGTAEDNANLDGLMNGTYINPDHPDVVLPSIAEIMASSSEVEVAGLQFYHVLALRLYTTSSYKSINDPFRQQPYPRLPHPFAATLYYISDALTRLRTVQGAHQSHANRQQTFWRGMIDLRVTEEFLEVGGTEMSCMSTTSSKEVAADFAKKSKTSPLLFKLSSNDFMSHGADISFLSVYPEEKEILYPPLTYLSPISRESSVEVIDGREYKVVEVKPSFGSMA